MYKGGSPSGFSTGSGHQGFHQHKYSKENFNSILTRGSGAVKKIKMQNYEIFK
jgi:hypothetical protein